MWVKVCYFGGLGHRRAMKLQALNPPTQIGLGSGVSDRRYRRRGFSTSACFGVRVEIFRVHSSLVPDILLFGS